MISPFRYFSHSRTSHVGTMVLVLIALVICAVAPAAYAQTYTVLYNLTVNSTDPFSPEWLGLFAQARDGNLYMGNTKIAKEEITGQIKDRLANKLDKTVYVKSDARAKYGDVVAIVDEIRSAGVDQLGLLTEKTQAPGSTPKPPQAQANPGD